MKDYSNYHNTNQQESMKSYGRLILDKTKNYDVTLDGFQTKVVIFDHTNPLDEYKEDRKIITDMTSTIHRGSEIVLENENYLVVTDIDNDQIKKYAKIRKCNHELKWLDESGIKQNFYCVISNKMSTGEEQDRYMSLAEGQNIITLPKNEHTEKINLDKRFIFNKSAWKVIDYNEKKIGLIELSVQKDSFTENDNRELEIADYYNNIHTYSIEILNGTQIYLQQNDTVQLSVKCLDNGIEVSNPSVIYSSSDSNIATVSSNGLITTIGVGIVAISATFNGISDTLNITIQESINHVYTVKITSPESMTIGTEITPICTWYDNGIEIESVASNWWIVSDDEISQSNLATVTNINGNGCTVKANNSIGYFKLYVINNLGTEGVKRIQVKGLW